MQRGADVVTIAECLGHANLSNTQKYTHIALNDVLLRSCDKGTSRDRENAGAAPIYFSRPGRIQLKKLL
jgi:hypothetical protein